ncbi:MAG: AAA family ATPase [Planctomycetota bacterium]
MSDEKAPANPFDRVFDAGHAVVACSTFEEQHTLELIKLAAYAHRVPVVAWSAVTGVRDAAIEGGGEPKTESPAAGLYHMARDPTRRVCVTLDLAPYFEDARVLRAWRELAHRTEERRGHLIMLDTTHELPALVDNYAVRLDVPFPSDEEIRRVTRRVVKRALDERSIEVRVKRSESDELIGSLRGLTRRQIERLLTGVISEDNRLDGGDIKRLLDEKRRLVADAGVLEHVDVLADLDQVAGLRTLKRWLEQRRAAFTPEAKQFGLDPPRGVLMLGVQGTGKSLTAKAVATAWRRPLVRLDPGRLYSKFIGESERTLRDALAQAEAMAPIVLWIDEIEKGFASVGGSGSSDGGLSKRMFGTMLTWMNDHRSPVFMIATANDIEALPPELLRKGRFDEIFFVDLPSPEVRRAVFEIHLKKRDRDPSEFDLDALAEAADGFSPAEIEQAIVGALHGAFGDQRTLDTEAVIAQLETSPPLSVTAREKVAALRAWAEGRCVPAD